MTRCGNPTLYVHLRVVERGLNTGKKLLSGSYRFRSSAADAGVDLSAEVHKANVRYKGDVMLKKTHGRGYGVFASRIFKTGETILRSNALDTFLRPHSHTIQVGWNQHALIDLPCRFLNHMCDPNLRLEANLHGAYDFIAIKPIAADEEIGFDYESSEYELDEPIVCECGASNCRTILRGFRYNGKVVQGSLGKENIAPYLLLASPEC